MSALARKYILPSASAALRGRAEALSTAPVNMVTGKTMQAPFPVHLQQCSLTSNPGYEEVRSGDTGRDIREFSEAHV